LIGDRCEDEYYIGSCERLSPEAPVPILKIQENFTTPGMAANVKKNFEALEQDVDFISNDKKIKKIRYIDKRSGQHLLRVDDEPKIPSWSGRLGMLRSVHNYDAIVISDYNKGFLTYEQIEKLIVENPTKPIFIDTKKTDLKRFTGAFIKINFYEYNKCISVPENEKGLIVTNGENGAMHSLKHYAAPKVDVADVCGAGDTFLAFLVYGYLESKDIDKAIELAIKAASESVKHRGNYAPKLTEVI
jgi:D-beta-D-heptose 7-phosphate kinase/D-beta-D-heptose 1-phosphate adenosyltransferase